jgi:FkbM family methyltransferase
MRPLGFVLAASDHGPLIVSRFDFNNSPSGGTYGVGAQILGNGVYEIDEISLIKHELGRLRRIDKEIVAIDCGANIGVLSLEMAKHMEGWGRVWAFEPQERLFYALCGNIALSNLYNIHADCNAVGAKSEILSIPVPDYNRPGSFGSMELRHSKTTEYIGQSIDYTKDLVFVNMVALDDVTRRLSSNSRIGFLKIDVEGMELDVLTGAQRLIQTHRPTILVEWIKVGMDKLENWFVEHDYSFQQSRMNYLAHPIED